MESPWCFVTSTPREMGPTVLKIRRLRDAAVVFEMSAPDGLVADELFVSTHDDTLVLYDGSRREAASTSLASGLWTRRALPAPYDAIVAVGGDGSLVCAAVDGVGARRYALFAPHLEGPPCEVPGVTALAPTADGFVFVVELSPRRHVVRRCHLDGAGRLVSRDVLELDGGPRHPLLLGLATGASSIVTQLMEAQGPPWIAVLAPGRPPARIARAWFDPRQAIVRGSALYHLGGFGQGELLRLELTEGSSPMSVFGARRLVALSPDAEVALVRLPESDLLEGSRVGLVHAALDVATGVERARLVLEAYETVGRWMVR